MNPMPVILTVAIGVPLAVAVAEGLLDRRDRRDDTWRCDECLDGNPCGSCPPARSGGS